ncbi:unnamed protein product, partial [Cylindrotheca closterium]
ELAHDEWKISELWTWFQWKKCWTKQIAARQGIDEAIDFLDGFGSDPLDVAEAKLEFDMEMADAKDIDDGATVAGAMDELLEKDSQLEAAITEIEFKENLLVEKSSALEAERLWSESLANELAALCLLQQTISSQEAQPALPPQPTATVSFPQDRSESAAADSAAKEPTLPATPARAAKSSPLTASLPSSPPRATTAIANQLRLETPPLLLLGGNL